MSDKNDALVSIVIPTYNRAALVCETIESCLAQTYTHLEIIVVDDASTDDTQACVQAMMAKDERIKYVRRAKHVNAQAARNDGIAQANGAFVNLLDSDDLLAPEKIACQISAFKENPDLDGVICQCGIFEEDPRKTTGVWGELPEEEDNNLIVKMALGEVKWQTAAPLWKKEFLVSLGPLPEELFCCQELELHLRAVCRKPKLHFESNALVFVRIHKDEPSMRRMFYSPERMWSQFLYIRYSCKYVKQAHCFVPSLRAFYLSRCLYYLRYFLRVKQWRAFVVWFHGLRHARGFQNIVMFLFLFPMLSQFIFGRGYWVVSVLAARYIQSNELRT